MLLALVTGCARGNDTAVPATQSDLPQAIAFRAALAIVPDAGGTNVIANPGFETGTISSWTSCGSASGPAASTAKVHAGSSSALIGAPAKPEVNGTKALCQTVAVPAAAALTFWVYEGTNDTIAYVDQEADVYTASGTKLATLDSEAKSTGAWVQKSFDMSAYAGQTVKLFFGVKGNGYASDYVYEYLDDVALMGSGAKPKPTSPPTGTPTSTPTATPTGNAFTCNDTQFTTYQSEFAAGSISADQFVDICGPVTSVLAKKTTSSGTHGYFSIEMPSGYKIEIVSNLDAMAEASTDKPPSVWPWVAVGQYAYVQGRYYYDSSSSQGVDWTEDDTSGSWEHVGYVAVCDSAGTTCSKYW